MKNKRIVITFVLEYILVTLLGVLISLIDNSNKGLSVFMYVETVIDLLLLIYLIILSKELFKDGIGDLFNSVKKFFSNGFVLISMFVLTFLAVTIASTNLTLNDVENYNQAGLEQYYENNKWLMGFKVIFIAPIIEEILFRGAIFGGIRKKNMIVAHVISATAFAFMHVWMQVISDGIMYLIVMLPYVIMGLGVSITYERTKNFLYPVTFHMMLNSLMFTMMNV